MTLMLRLENNVTMLYKTTNAIRDEFHCPRSTSTLGVKQRSADP
jgi:hypothetical protein